MPKNVLQNIPVLAGAPVNQDSYSRAINVAHLDNMAVQGVPTGTPSGTLIVQKSVDHSEYFGTVVNEGNWNEQVAFTAYSTGGSPETKEFSTAAGYIRVKYQNQTPNSGTITTLGNTANALQNKYFLADGADGINYYFWMDSDGTGTDPMVPGRTGIQVDLQNGDFAADVATNIGNAFTNLASDTFVVDSVTDNVVAFSQVTTIDPGGIQDSVAAPTGFAFTYVGATGSVSAYLSAKAV